MTQSALSSLFKPATYPQSSLTPPRTLLSQMFTRGEALLQNDPDYLEHFSHPSGRYDVGAIDLVKSHGPYLFTTKGTYFDATFSWMTDLLDAERHEQLRSPTYLELIGKLAQEDRTPTEDKMSIEAAFVDMMKNFWLDAYKILPVSAGGLATDDAMEIAIGQVADKLKKEPRELKGIAFEGAFHGRYGHGAEGTANIDKVGHKHTGRTVHVAAPILQYDSSGGVNEEKTQEVFEQSMLEVEEKLKDDNFAYIVSECPMQAEGGARIINPQTFSHLHDLCQKYGKVLVADCIQMGGRAWTIDGDFVSPFAKEVLKFADIITFGKIFHANGTMVRDFTKLNRGFGDNWVDTYGPKRLGGTWTGHISQMATGYAIVQTVLQKKLYKNAIQITQSILTAMQKMVKKYPHLLTNARGRSDAGYLAWSFVNSEMRDAFKKRMIENEHIIFLTAGDTSIRLAPCADMTQEEADALLEAIDNQLSISPKTSAKKHLVAPT